ncbi:unnamed protein product [Acanthoscelides obtectus]|uniref:Uncharacterized protein n=1 Tax=Acanthoscelides obtectus TaxID=200917 RepID=A0A9P0PU77_ACAOB|nr:unnamed protein product [Acanthoscelides obtectus]CAK1631041.1 hypothetical protein AOBTE_LOCUS6721 [Acanthoscelides obtectus]
MKQLLIAIALFGVALCGRLDKDYLPPVQGVQANSAFSSPQQPNTQGSTQSYQYQPSGQQYQQQQQPAQQYQNQQASQQYQPQQPSQHFANQQPAQQYQSQPSGQQYQNQYAGQAAQPVGPAGPINKEANDVPILRLDNNVDGETYNYALETGNGIVAHEQGETKGEGTRAQGGYTYTAPDGQVISIQYIADENGYQPQGSHLPVAPPVPEEIQKAVEQNLADEARGIFDDGQYREENNPGQQYIQAQRPGQNQGYGGQDQHQGGQGQPQYGQSPQYPEQSQPQNQGYLGQNQQYAAQSQQHSGVSRPGQQYQGAPAQNTQYPSSQANNGAGGYKY